MIFNIEERGIVPRGRYGQLINLIKKFRLRIFRK